MRVSKSLVFGAVAAVGLAGLATSARAATVNTAILDKVTANGDKVTAITYKDTDSTRVVYDAGADGVVSIGDILEGQFEITELQSKSKTFAKLGADNIGASTALIPSQELTGIYQIQVTAVTGNTIQFQPVALTSAIVAAVPGHAWLVGAFGNSAMMAAWREDLSGGTAYDSTDGTLASATGGSLYAVLGMVGQGSEKFESNVFDAAFLNYGAAASLEGGVQFATTQFKLNIVPTLAVQEAPRDLKLIPFADGTTIQGNQGLFSAKGLNPSFPFNSVTSLNAQIVPLPASAWMGLSMLGGLAVMKLRRSRRK